MTNWTNKHWGAVIGGLVMFLIVTIGLDDAALVVVVAVLGYFVGKFLDGEFDLEDIRERSQRRRQPR